MNVTLEMIDQLRQRANVSYEEAKDALERSNGDMVEAIVYLERNNKVRRGSGSSVESSFVNTVKELLKKGQQTKFLMKKHENVVINVPVNVVVLTTIVMPPITIVGVIVGIFTGHKIKFVKPDGGSVDVNRYFDKMTTAVATTNQSNEIVQK